MISDHFFDSKYSLASIVITLGTLNQQSMGRYELSNYLGLSKAKTRALLEYLHERGITQTKGKSSGRSGTSLTSLGKTLIKKIHQLAYIDFSNPKYASDSLNVSQSPANIDNPKPQIRRVVFLKLNKNGINGISERDIAIRFGANGAITLIFNHKHWSFEDGTPIEKYDHSFNPGRFARNYNFCSIVTGTIVSSVYNSLANIISFYFKEEIIELFETT